MLQNKIVFCISTLRLFVQRLDPGDLQTHFSRIVMWAAPFWVQVTWRWQPFSNPARADKLALEHWVKCYKDQTGSTRPADEGEYSFAKFNKKVQAPAPMPLGEQVALRYCCPARKCQKLCCFICLIGMGWMKNFSCALLQRSDAGYIAKTCAL